MRLVIFDCDGTLVDSQHKIAKAMQLAFESLELEWPGREATLGVVGLSLVEAMERLLPGSDRSAHEALAQAYRDSFFSMRQEEMDNEPFYDGAFDALMRLSGRDDILLGVATGKSQKGLRRLIEREGLEKVFVTLQTSDDAPSKPHPGMIHQAMDEAGIIDPQHAVMVGDTSYDIEMARAAGIYGLGVSWGYHHVGELEHAGAHKIIHEFNELDHFLESIWKP